MLFSEKHKYIFIAIPKTGTTAITSFLLENDSSCLWNQIKVGDKKIKIDEHDKPKKIKKIMGEEYNKYTVFTFIRDPYARVVSGFFFYKTVERTKSKYMIRNILARLNTILPKIIPFSIWSVIRPEKRLVDYFFDDHGQQLIDLVGKTENMNEDFASICNLIGLPLENINIPVKNSSKHSSVEEYFSNELHKKIYGNKIKRDIKLYDKYKDRLHTERFRQGKILEL